MNNTQEKVSLKGVWKFTLTDIITGKIRTFTYENLIPTAGRAALANGLTDATPSPATTRVNYTSLGSGTNSPSNADTTLQTETFRKAIASATNADNVAYLTAFYTALEAVATHREAGLHIEGTGSANTGTLFSRVAINITKSNTETLTIDYTVTIS